jgi:hypothetical protein
LTRPQVIESGLGIELLSGEQVAGIARPVERGRILRLAEGAIGVGVGDVPIGVGQRVGGADEIMRGRAASLRD